MAMVAGVGCRILPVGTSPVAVQQGTIAASGTQRTMTPETPLEPLGMRGPAPPSSHHIHYSTPRQVVSTWVSTSCALSDKPAPGTLTYYIEFRFRLEK